MIAQCRSMLAGDADVLIAKLLFDGEFLSKHAGLISIDLFMREPHRSVARAVLDRHERGELFDADLIVREVSVSGGFDEQRLADEIGKWLDFEVFGEQRAIDAIRQLRNNANVMRLDRILDDAKREIQGDPFADPSQIIGNMQERFESMKPATVSERITLASLMVNDLVDETDDVLATGIDFFDQTLPGGGFAPGDKLFLSAPPKTGKSALALQCSLGLLQTNQNLRIVWAAGEMSLRVLRRRAMMCMSRLTLGVLRRPWADLGPLQEQSKRDAIDELRDIGERMTFVQAPLTVGAIEAEILATGSRFCVIDYLQLLKPDTLGSCRRDDVDEVIHQIERMAQRHGIAFFIISNQGKGAISGRNIFDAFKESSEVAHAADLAFVGEIVGWNGTDDLDPDIKVYWRCLKARHGEERSMMTWFHRPIQHFEGVGL